MAFGRSNETTIIAPLIMLPLIATGILKCFFAVLAIGRGEARRGGASPAGRRPGVDRGHGADHAVL